MVTGEDWEVEVRHAYGDALDMITYYEWAVRVAEGGLTVKPA